MLMVYANALDSECRPIETGFVAETETEALEMARVLLNSEEPKLKFEPLKASEIAMRMYRRIRNETLGY